MAHNFKDFPELTNSQMQFYYFESPHKQIMEDFIAKVVKVIDGDTIKVKWDERDFDFPIRFANTAAPERKEPGGLESREWLREQVLGKEVTIEINPSNRVGKWGRILGTVILGGIDINQMSIDLGFAVDFHNRENIWGHF